MGKQTPDTKRVENLNFRRRLEFTKEVPDTWVSPNMISQVSLIPDIGRPEEQPGVPAEKSNRKTGRSEVQLEVPAQKSNQKTGRSEVQLEAPAKKSNQNPVRSDEQMGVQVEKSNQKLVSKHGQKLNQHENTSPESTKSGSTESASPARNRGKISQPLKHF